MCVRTGERAIISVMVFPLGIFYVVRVCSVDSPYVERERETHTHAKAKNVLTTAGPSRNLTQHHAPVAGKTMQSCHGNSLGLWPMAWEIFHTVP